MRLKVTPAGGAPAPRWSDELAPLRDAVVGAKDDAAFIAAVGQIKVDDSWEEQPDLYHWSDVLDRVDEFLESGLKRDPSLVLIPVNDKDPMPMP
ncbi:unnamed protein product, partial [Discosporangium mesarthrocarpum]